MQYQKGFLLVTAVVMIVIFALLSTALVSMFVRATETTLHLQAIPQAAALAESGLEQARANFNLTNFTTRQTCVSLATTVSLPTGDSITSRATNNANNPRYAYATLTTAIASNTTPATLSVNDSSVFSSDGWVLIGREVFQYGYIADATTLGGVVRAQDGTQATAQPVGATVSQYECSIAGIGHAPATNPMSVREYQQGMRQPLLFAVGQNGMILNWNGPTAELLWATQTSGTALDINAISALNYHSAWAVANQSASGFSFLRLQGNTWTNIAVSLGQNTDLLGVDATSTNEAWAVGKRQGGNSTILRWVRNGANASNNWCNASASSCPGISMTEASINNSQKDIYAIKTYDLNGDGYADMGFAVGGSHDASGKVGVIWYYSGTGWGPINKAPLSYALPANVSELRGLDITRNGNAAPKEAFFVGHSALTGGKLLRLRIVNGVASWVTVNTAQDLIAVSVVDTDGDGLADFGCAVGSNGYAAFFDSAMNTTVTQVNIEGTNFNNVLVLSPSDIWIVGDWGARYHYDGTGWSLLASNVPTTQHFYGLSGIFPKQTTLSTWHELIN